MCACKNINCLINHPDTLNSIVDTLNTQTQNNKKMKLSVDNLDNNIFLNGKDTVKISQNEKQIQPSDINFENTVNISKVKVK